MTSYNTTFFLAHDIDTFYSHNIYHEESSYDHSDLDLKISDVFFHCTAISIFFTYIHFVSFRPNATNLQQRCHFICLDLSALAYAQFYFKEHIPSFLVALTLSFLASRSFKKEQTIRYSLPIALALTYHNFQSLMITSPYKQELSFLCESFPQYIAFYNLYSETTHQLTPEEDHILFLLFTSFLCRYGEILKERMS